jgi:hypothetical protein
MLFFLALAGALGACAARGEQATVRAEAPPPTATTEAVTTPSTTSTSTSTTTTAAPRPSTTRATPVPTTPRTTPTAAAATGCHPSYVGACLPPDAVDVDCAGGGGNGPVYVYAKRFKVVGPDVYRLDADGDGIACES